MDVGDIGDVLTGIGRVDAGGITIPKHWPLGIAATSPTSPKSTGSEERILIPRFLLMIIIVEDTEPFAEPLELGVLRYRNRVVALGLPGGEAEAVANEDAHGLVGDRAVLAAMPFEEGRPDLLDWQI